MINGEFPEKSLKGEHRCLLVARKCQRSMLWMEPYDAKRKQWGSSPTFIGYLCIILLYMMPHTLRLLAYTYMSPLVILYAKCCQPTASTCIHSRLPVRQFLVEASVILSMRVTLHPYILIHHPQRRGYIIPNARPLGVYFLQCFLYPASLSLMRMPRQLLASSKYWAFFLCGLYCQ